MSIRASGMGRASRIARWRNRLQDRAETMDLKPLFLGSASLPSVYMAGRSALSSLERYGTMGEVAKVSGTVYGTLTAATALGAAYLSWKADREG